MPLGLTQSGYYSGADKSFDERLRDNKVRQMAAAQNKSVKDFLEDRDHFKEIAAIDSEAQEEAEIDAGVMMDQEYDKRTVQGEPYKRRGQEGIALSELEANQAGRIQNKLEKLKWERQVLGIGDPDDPAETGHMINEILPGLHKKQYGKTQEDFAENELDRMAAEASAVAGEDPQGFGEGFKKGPMIRVRMPNGDWGWKQEDAGEQGGFMPPSSEANAEAQINEKIAAGGQADADQFGRDEESPPVKQMKEVQKKAAGGDKKAIEDRKDLFKGKSKEQTAMDKEALGNYYIGPGGWAIDLDEVDKSLSREGDFELLQHLPDHAKGYMLMKMGYINKEDYEGMPESPEFHLEEMKLIKALDKEKLIQEAKTKRTTITGESGATVATIQTEAQKIMSKDRYATATDVQKMKSHTTETVTKMGIDYNLLRDKSIELMALNDNDLEREIATMQNTTANEEIQAHSRRLTKQLNSNERIKGWDIDAQKVLQADSLEKQSALALELKGIDQNITRDQIAGVRQNLISQLENDTELGELGINAQKLIAGDKNETERYRITAAKWVDLKKIRQAGAHFTKEIAFKYKELGANTLFKNAQLGQLSAVEMLKHNRLTEEQRQTWFVRQHTANQQVANSLFDTGQVEAAMMIMARNGVSNPPNVKAYWKERGVRMEDSDAVKSAALGLKLSVKEANKGYLKALNAEHNKLINTKLDADEYTELDRAVIQAGEKPWSQMSDNERAEQVDSAGRPIQSFLHWQATKIQDALDRRIKLGPYGKYHAAMKSDEMEIQLKAGQKIKDQEKGASGETLPKTEEVVKEIAESGRDISKTAGRVFPTVIEEELKRLNPTPEKMSGSLKKGEEKFNNILKAESKIADKRLMMFNNKEELLNYFEKRPELLAEPASISSDTIGHGVSGSLIGTSKKNSLNLQHYVIKELAKRKEQPKPKRKKQRRKTGKIRTR